MRRTVLILLAATLLAPASPAIGASQTGPPPEVPLRVPGCQDMLSGPLTAQGGVVRRETDGDEVPLDEKVIVSPPRIDVARGLTAGDSFTCTITVRSRRSEVATFQLEPLGIVGSRQRNARFEFVGPDDERFESTAGGWIVPALDEVTLRPRGVVHVPVTVTIPANPPVGSAYGSIDVVSRTRTGEGEAVVGVETHVATVFLLPIGGEGAPELHLRDVAAPRLRWSREPWPLTADLDNDGTLHADAAGRVRVRSIFGNTVAELPIRGETVLPRGRAEIDVHWEGVPWFGFYRYDVRVDDGDEVARASGWFVALPPWWVLVLIGVALIVLVLGASRRRRTEIMDAHVDEWDENELE